MITNPVEVTLEALINEFGIDQADVIKNSIDRTRATHVVMFENQLMGASEFGKRSILCVGEHCTYSLQEALKSHLGDVPSRFQYPVKYAVARKRKMITPWSDDKVKQLHAMALQSFKHYHGTRKSDNDEAANCEACCLEGHPASFYDDIPTDAPNVSNWMRIYVEAQQPIPKRFRSGFERERKENDNVAYLEALERSILTFGLHFEK